MTESAIAYLRVSDPHDDGSGLANQRESVMRYAAEHGYSILDVIEEKQTGTLYRERAGLQAALEALKQGRATVLLIDRLDRISRRQSHCFVIDEACRDAGGRLESALDQFEDSPEGRLLFSVKAFIAEIDRERILMRTVAGRRARVERKQQLIPGQRPLYGYAWRDDTRGAYEIDARHAPVVQRIYAAACAGHSQRSIAVDLSADGIPTPTGNARWATSSVRLILTHPHYCGDAWAWVWRPLEAGRKNTRFDPDNGFLLPDGTIPAIVSRETWQSVQRVLAGNRHRKRADTPHADAALMRGRVICAHCGHALYVSPRRGRLTYRCESRYRYATDCTVHSVFADELDADAWRYATKIIRKPQAFLRGREAASRRPDRSSELAVLTASIARLTRLQTTLARRIADEPDDLAATALLSELRAVAAQLRTAEDGRASLMDDIAAGGMADQAVVDLETWCREIVAGLPDLSFAGRRQVTDMLGLQASVSRRGIVPQWTFSANPLRSEAVQS